MIQKGDIYGELTRSAEEGMKGAELPVSDVFINGYGQHEGTIQKSKAKISNYGAKFSPSGSKSTRNGMNTFFTHILGDFNATEEPIKCADVPKPNMCYAIHSIFICLHIQKVIHHTIYKDTEFKKLNLSL